MATIKEKAVLEFEAKSQGAQRGVRNLRQSVDELGNTTTRSNSRSVASWGGVVTAIVGVVGAYKTLKTAQAFMKSSIAETLGFEKAMAEVATITSWTAAQQHEYSQNVLDFSRKTGIQATSVAKALYQTISAGVADATDAQIVMNEALEFGNAALVEAGDAVDVVTTVLNSYQLEADQAARVTDVLFTTIRLGKTTGSELAGSLGRVVPIAAQAGVEFEDLSAAMVMLTRAGLSTDEATTALRQLLLSIVAPTDQAKEAIEGLGLTMFNEATLAERGGLNKILQELSTQSDGTVGQLSELIPNVRALISALALVAQEDDAAKILAEINSSAGAVDTALAKVEATWSHMFERIGNNWEILKIQAGAGLLEIFGQENLAKLLDDLDTFIERLGEVGDVYTTAIESGASKTEALAAAGEHLALIWEETLGQSLPVLIEELVNALEGAWSFIQPVILSWVDLMASVLLPKFIQLGRDVGLGLFNALVTALQEQATSLALDAVLGGLSPLYKIATGQNDDRENRRDGGRIGRASGGPVTGQPGPDRVKANLTDGEYVLRPEAVEAIGSAFGGQFLDAMNALGPGVMNVNIGSVPSAGAATAAAPRLASGFARFRSVGAGR